MTAQGHGNPRAFRTAVVPLALVLLSGGLTLVVLALAAPLRIVPLVQDPGTRRAVVIATGLLSMALSVGLLLRSAAAWYAMFASLAVGTVWGAAGFLWDGHFRVFGQIRYFLAALTLVIGAALVVGLYTATRSVFGFKRESNP